jgi:hypothetical protein
LKLLEDRDLEITGGCLYTENGLRIELDERIGTYFPPGSETRLSWRCEEDDIENLEGPEQEIFLYIGNSKCEADRSQSFREAFLRADIPIQGEFLEAPGVEAQFPIDCVIGGLFESAYEVYLDWCFVEDEDDSDHDCDFDGDEEDENFRNSEEEVQGTNQGFQEEEEEEFPLDEGDLHSLRELFDDEDEETKPVPEGDEDSRQLNIVTLEDLSGKEGSEEDALEITVDCPHITLQNAVHSEKKNHPKDYNGLGQINSIREDEDIHSSGNNSDFVDNRCSTLTSPGLQRDSGERQPAADIELSPKSTLLKIETTSGSNPLSLDSPSSLKMPTEIFREAIVNWNGWTMIAFFREGKIDEDIGRRIKEAWGLKRKWIYYIINGHGQGYTPTSYPIISSIKIVIKGRGGADVVIQGPGGWELELDIQAADHWLWHCGLAQSEIKGWSYQSKLQGGERIIFLRNPRQGRQRQRGMLDSLDAVERSLQEKIDQFVQISEPGRPLKDYRISDAWDWACDWVSRNGMGSVKIGGDVGKFEELKKGTLLQAMWENALPNAEYKDSDPPAIREMKIRKILDPEMPDDEARIENEKREESLTKRLKNGIWAGSGAYQYKNWNWKEVKEKIKKWNAWDGCDLLVRWTDQDLERAKKTGIRALLRYTGWFELNQKVFKKRLKHDKEEGDKVLTTFKAVQPPGLTPMKGWTFVGFSRIPKPVLLPRLQNNYQEVWEETIRGGSWVPLDQGRSDIIESKRDQMKVLLNGLEIQSDDSELRPGDVIELGALPHTKSTEIWVWDTERIPRLMQMAEAKKMMQDRLEWIRKDRILLLRNGTPWEQWRINSEGTITLQFQWRNKVCCADDEKRLYLWAEQVRTWTGAHGDQRVLRNEHTWDEETIRPGDFFEIRGRLRGGAGPTKSRDLYSVRNYCPRMARRKRIEAVARELREKQRAEEDLEESIRWKATEITYEGHEFVTRDFVNDEWNKYTAHRFARWVQSFSGLPRESQKIIDMSSGKEFTEIQGKSLALLNDDEVWENGQIMLRRKKISKFPWRGIRTSPVRVFLRIRNGCIWKAEGPTTFKGRVVRMLKKGDARKSISLFEKDHQGIRVQPGWLGISSLAFI